jgi:HEAT repeat protein
MATLFLTGFEIQIRNISNWLGLIIFIVIVLILIADFISHIKAKKIVKEKMKDSGIDYLIKTLKSGEYQEEVIEELGKSRDPRAVPALIEFVNSEEVKNEEDGYKLSMGLNALAQTKDPKAIDFLISSLSNPDLVVRFYVCSAIANQGIRDFRAVEPIIALLKDIKDIKKRKDPLYDEMFENWVKQALEVITGKRFGNDHEKWEKWWEENKQNYI